jgi:phospholipid-transporting ATPase
MSDFTRLVSLNNPAAAARYQPAGNGYPPSSSRNDELLDPFFDDDDELPDTAFGGPPPPSGSQQSGLHLVPGAAPPAGALSNSNHAGDGHGKIISDWAFDDDELQTSPSPFPSSSSLGTPSSADPYRSTRRRRKRWKWPWQKEKVVKGDRIIALNDETSNVDFPSNHVYTSKFNLLTFLPKFLTGMFLAHVCAVLI